MINLFLIGAGYWGKNWYKTASKYPIKIIESNRVHEAIYGDVSLNKTPVYATIDEALDKQSKYQLDLENDKFIVSTPASTHFDLFNTLTKKYKVPAKNILVEKPCGTSLAEIDKMKGVIPGFIFLFDPKYQYIKSHLHLIGTPFSFRSVRASMGPRIRTDVSIVEDYLIHDLYIYLDLFKERYGIDDVEFRELFSSPIKNGEVDVKLGSTDRDFEARFMSSWWYPKKERSIIIVGDKGAFLWENDKLLFFDGYYQRKLNYRDPQGNIDYHLHEGQYIEIQPKETRSNLELELEAFSKNQYPFDTDFILLETWKLINDINEE